MASMMNKEGKCESIPMSSMLDSICSKLSSKCTSFRPGFIHISCIGVKNMALNPPPKCMYPQDCIIRIIKC